MEHVRNHAALLRRVSGWLTPGAPLFVHVFAHRRLFWPFEDEGPGDWMARHFFTGGIMPSHDYVARVPSSFRAEQSWWIEGEHYRRTLDAWLALLDGRIDEVREVLTPVYRTDLDVWVRRWRMFFMACSEFFGHRSRDLGVSHHVLRAASS